MIDANLLNILHFCNIFSSNIKEITYMLEELNKVLKKIFTNEETIIFSFSLLIFFIVISFFGSVLTPFIISIIVAYLLVGMQKKIQSYNISEKISLVITFSIFIVTGATLVIWLVPLLYTQLQAFVLDVPNLISNFRDFISDLPSKFPDLVSSDQITIFFQAVSEEISALAQNIVKTSISSIQSAITVLLYIILFPILFIFFFLIEKILLMVF